MKMNTLTMNDKKELVVYAVLSALASLVLYVCFNHFEPWLEVNPSHMYLLPVFGLLVAASLTSIICMVIVAFTCILFPIYKVNFNHG